MGEMIVAMDAEQRQDDIIVAWTDMESQQPAKRREAVSTPIPTDVVHHARWCSLDTVKSFAKAFSIYVTLVVVTSVTAIYVYPRQLGLVLLSLMPSMYLMSYLRGLYRHSVIGLQILWVCLETLACMCPIGEWEY